MDPQMAAALARADEITRSLGPSERGIEAARRRYLEARAWWNEGGAEIGPIIEQTFSGPFGDRTLRIFYPQTEGPLPAYVFLHGGGYSVGGCDTDDWLLRQLVAAWGGIAISADYVHTPEHLFPDAVEEMAALYAWLANNGGRWGIDGNRLAFGGASAGANVALGAALHLGGTARPYLKAAIMFSADMDHDPDSPSMRAHGDGAIFPSRQTIISSHQAYIGDPANDGDMRVNCTLAEAALIPPMFIGAAELDVLLDSSKRMAEHLRENGRPHRFEIYPGVTHLFTNFGRMVSRTSECVSDAAAFLGEFV
jgi:acetyl esterase